VDNESFTKLPMLPASSGVYLFKDGKERVLYVGKAKNLKNRVRSYFHKGLVDERKAKMVMQARDISFVVTENEVEALALEANFIKQYKPPFNILLKDDKAYPYLCVKLNEQWPFIEIVRRYSNDGNIYIGPYISSRGMKECLEFIKRYFPIRTCRYSLNNIKRPCIQYQIGNCGGPCAGHIDRDAYMDSVNDVIAFLKGERKELINRLNQRMQALSDQLEYEEAAKIRDRISAITGTWDTQKVVSNELGDMDVIGYAQSDDGSGLFNIFFVRGGSLIGVKDFYLKDVAGLRLGEMLYSFIEQFYSKDLLPPTAIITPKRPDNITLLTKWMKKKHGVSVKISSPKDGRPFELLGMAQENAIKSLSQKTGTSYIEVCHELAQRLGLSEVIEEIGAFDISNISGQEAVGSFVFWQRGNFEKSRYRHIRIKTVVGINDYAMMKEAVIRIVRNLKDKLPDLILIDGGLGQLGSAIEGIKESGIDVSANIVGIAKKPDRIFQKGSDNPIYLDDGSPSSLLLIKIRDEAHRFAITYHRKLRDNRILKSPLDNIKGISKIRRLALLKHFGSIKKIKAADPAEIASIKGFNSKLANLIVNELNYLHEGILSIGLKHPQGD
jgi:excinuclease ABC subunit C